MYGDEALKLIKEAKRANDSVLPTYNEAVVRNTCKEINTLAAETSDRVRKHRDTIQTSRGLACGVLIYDRIIHWNKRCVLAYHKHRIERIKQICWELGSIPSKDVRKKLSSSEATFARDYFEMMTKYKSLLPNLQLTSGPHPPKDLFIEARVVKDCGAIDTEYGSFVLKKHTQHYLPRADVERLIAQGYLYEVE
ncbi:hypothetical protein BKA69DRAFT_1058787 [Paraphysoderma sedebokerense]|nr:hypothetical protein BKA69DRAFT_1058787 [Paraphysoderma sedebokerense]